MLPSGKSVERELLPALGLTSSSPSPGLLPELWHSGRAGRLAGGPAWSEILRKHLRGPKAGRDEDCGCYRGAVLPAALPAAFDPGKEVPS